MLPITATIFKFAAATSATKEITSFGIDKANILFRIEELMKISQIEFCNVARHLMTKVNQRNVRLEEANLKQELKIFNSGVIHITYDCWGFNTENWRKKTLFEYKQRFQENQFF